MQVCVAVQSDGALALATQVVLVPSWQMTPDLQSVVTHAPQVAVPLQTLPTAAAVTGVFWMQAPVAPHCEPTVQDEVVQAAQVAPVAALHTVPVGAGAKESTQAKVAQSIVPVSHGFVEGTHPWFVHVEVQTPARQKLPVVPLAPQFVPSAR